MSRLAAPSIGLISDCSLTLFDLQSVLTEAGYQVSLCCRPERISSELLARETIDAWYVSLSREFDGDSLLSALFDLDVPVLIDETMVKQERARRTARWRERVLNKLRKSGVQASPARPCRQERANPLLARAQASSLRRQAARNVWVLGASLGGPKAMVEFLSHLPGDVPACFIYAQHIDDNCSKTLMEVMSRCSALRVRALSDGDTLTHGQLAIVPVTKAFQIGPLGQVTATGQPWAGAFLPSINQVACDVANVYRERAGLMVFSGMGDDGAMACSEMNRCGGRVWVQEPVTCVCSAMPDAAIGSSGVDFVGEPRRLAEKLAEEYNPSLMRSGA